MNYINKQYNVKTYLSSLQIINNLGYNPPKLYLTYANLEEIPNNDKTYYFMMDCPGGEAFIHWIGEIFIFLPILDEINKTYENVKIITTNKKKYVNNMFRFFDIKNEICDNIDNLNNIIFFPPTISLNDYDIDMNLFSTYLEQYIYQIEKKITLTKHILPKLSILYLPRNSVDNFLSNDRKIKNQEEIEQYVIEKGGTVLNTYQINNINIQFQLINNADSIVVDAGSSFYFNCMWIKNKNIYVLDSSMFSQLDNHKTLRYIYDKIRENNKVVCLPANSLYRDYF